MSNKQQKPDTSCKPSAWQVILSTLAAAFGVQSSNNQERDFKHGKISHFIIAGVLFTLVFIAVIYTLVSVVLKYS